MKKIFWNVGIEIYEDGTVKAAVLRNRLAVNQPSDDYKCQPKREVYSVWFDSEIDAHSAVFEALAMNEEQEVAA